MMHPQTAEYLRLFVDGMHTLSETNTRIGAQKDVDDVQQWLDRVVTFVRIECGRSQIARELIKELDQTCD